MTQTFPATSATATPTPSAIIAQPEVILMLDIETLAASSERAVVSQAALIGYDLETDEMIPFRHHQFYPLDPQIKRSEEHTSELQSLMSISYVVFCLQKKHNIIQLHLRVIPLS